ncbi:hypothetical protein [Cerasicoccus fimbriatus]|uniref:hypothetical protein n=1 Tax=Cerasicoccus fimbriatus TaxID=3014554 RepID=UPI0022B40F7E|nr:hypothetical protein [Cerasicoccus sp. TK19100]
MKTTPRSPTDHTKPLRSPPGKPGFALVISLTLMSLIILLVISMATLVKVELSTELHTQNQSLARQNALFGLQVAIGQLQQQMGPDKRVSATASILDITPEDANFDDSEAAPNVRQPHWTGVWNSLDWDRSSNREDSPSLPKASDGKPNEFRGWLVSGFSNTQLTGAEMIGQATSFDPDADDSILLVGEGTVGQTTTPRSDFVYATREVLQTEDWNQSGFAYWVGDEGVKAPINGESIEDANVSLEKLNAISSNSRANLRALKDWSELDYETLNPSTIYSHDILKLSAVRELNNSEAYQGKFHDVSPYSSGMLIDTRNGGFRKDLSLSFSQEDLPEAFVDETGNPRKMFYLGSEANPTISGPGWDYVKRFHNRYQILESHVNAAPSFDILDVRSEVHQSLAPNKKGDTPLPVLVRYQYVFSLYQGYNTYDGLPYDPEEQELDGKGSGKGPATTDYQSNEKIVYLMVTPIYYVWNPYNVTIEMPKGKDSSLNLLPSFPDIEFSFDGGARFKEIDQIFEFYVGELVSLNTPNHELEDAIIIPPGEMRLITLSKANNRFDEYKNKLWVNWSDRDVFWGDAAGGNSWRAQNSTTNFSESTMGLFSPTLLPSVQNPGLKSAPDTKLLASGNSDIHVRIKDSESKFLFKVNVGGEGGNRQNAGVFHVNSSDPMSTNYHSSEYIHDETISLGSLPEIIDSNYNFTGLSPLFSMTFDVRAFDEQEGLGKPGLFTDPTNGHFYTETVTEAAMAVAPFNFAFESDAASGDYLQFDPNTSRAFFRSGLDLVYSNVAKELPVSPMLSLGQLEHAPLGRDYDHLVYQYTEWGSESTPPSKLQPSDPRRRDMAPVYNRAVGNGYLHPMIAADEVWNGAYNVDRSYFLNDTLFDSYFFSGLANNGGPFAPNAKTGDQLLDDLLEGDYELLNPAYSLNLTDGETLESIASSIGETSGDEYLRLAAFLAVNGAFNINSTSVDAWAAMLSASRGKTVIYTDASDGEIKEDNDALRTPIISKTFPSGASADSQSNYNSANASLWSGYRALTDEQIHELAEQIVAQVKARGPFLSLGQFLNREVSNRNDFNRTGGVQAAIDKTTINISADNVSISDALKARFDSSEVTESDIQDLVGVESPHALLGDRNEGLPGYITQAELLKPIMPVLSARSETFLIRAYGDVRNADGVVAEAWCEAVVQRKPNYVNPEDPTSPQPWELPEADTPADTFGREFEIVSFRWLAKDEV